MRLWRILSPASDFGDQKMRFRWFFSSRVHLQEGSIRA